LEALIIYKEKIIMRRLLEWKAMPSQPSTISYEDRLQKLLDYHIAQFPKKLTPANYIRNCTMSLAEYSIDLLREDKDCVWLDYRETTTETPGRVKPTDTSEREVNVKYNKNTTEWSFEFTMNDMPMVDNNGKQFNNLIKEFSKVLFWLPDENTKEYKEITESVSNSTIDDFKAYENLWS
jgi:hypothetical protein